MDKAWEPKWLENFLSRAFFDPCSTHHLHRNELNRYCVDCKVSVCQHCSSSETHQQHKILKMYRHCYRDVVSLDSIEKHMDISQIQVTSYIDLQVLTAYFTCSIKIYAIECTLVSMN